MILDLFGFQGRIGRFGWWMTQLFFIVGGFLYGLFLGELPPTPSVLEPKSVKEVATIVSEMTLARLNDPVVVAIQVISYWLFATTSVQRLHDQDKSGGRVMLAFVPIVLIGVGLYLLHSSTNLTAGFACLALGGIGMIVAVVWSLIEFGMLRGDDTDNEYGPPPGEESRRKALREELDAMGEAYVRSEADAPTGYPVAVASGQLFGRR